MDAMQENSIHAVSLATTVTKISNNPIFKILKNHNDAITSLFLSNNPVRTELSMFVQFEKRERAFVYKLVATKLYFFHVCCTPSVAKNAMETVRKTSYPMPGDNISQGWF